MQLDKLLAVMEAIRNECSAGVLVALRPTGLGRFERIRG